MANPKLQQLFHEMTEIADVSFGLYDASGELLAGSTNSSVEEKRSSEGLFADGKKEKIVEDATCYLITAGIEEYVLVMDSIEESKVLAGRMAANQVRRFLETASRENDKNAFALAMITGTIEPEAIAGRAAKHRLKEMDRVVYVIELAQPLMERATLSMLTSLFADGKQDVFFQKTETQLVLIKAYDKPITQEEQQKFALSMVDMLLSELMIKTRVGYSTMKHAWEMLAEGYREAVLALRIAAVFQEQKEAVAYARLGIARLIYELPKDLCETFLHEVFGEKLPERQMDEELQITIRKFFENNLNISETARQLYLHRNTLVYRLERFEKQIGLDIRRFDDAMMFQIGMMVLAHYHNLCEQQK
ncbi:MAG: helix-turn-helix domain-containing protein [bacterium]|nr:helix-turn-helix domain-containing protein [bacterium]